MKKKFDETDKISDSLRKITQRFLTKNNAFFYN